jgi:hypothetical protein
VVDASLANLDVRAGDPDVVEKLKKGHRAIGRTDKNHIDGYNLESKGVALLTWRASLHKAAV